MSLSLYIKNKQTKTYYTNSSLISLSPPPYLSLLVFHVLMPPLKFSFPLFFFFCPPLCHSSFLCLLGQEFSQWCQRCHLNPLHALYWICRVLQEDHSEIIKEYAELGKWYKKKRINF